MSRDVRCLQWAPEERSSAKELQHLGVHKGEVARGRRFRWAGQFGDSGRAVISTRSFRSVSCNGVVCLYLYLNKYIYI